MKKVVFMGTPDFAVPILKSLLQSPLLDLVLVVTQPDRPVGRKQVLKAPPVKDVAMKYKLPIFQPERLQDEYEEVLKVNPDIIITAAYGQLLPIQLLEAPAYGCINVHASLLPKYRGGAPIHHAIINGEKTTGITIMYMVEALDAGDIISQDEIPIAPNDHVGDLHDELAELGASLLLKTLPTIFDRSNERIKQKEEDVTFAPNITREDERIDWKKTDEQIYNQIRGLHPWPVAYTSFNEHRIKIWWAERNNETYDGEPGEIVAINEDSIVVLAGNGKGVELTEIQPSGRKRMTVETYIQGNALNLMVGERLN